MILVLMFITILPMAFWNQSVSTGFSEYSTNVLDFHFKENEMSLPSKNLFFI